MNNIFEGACPSLGTFSHNLVRQSKCGSTDVVGQPSYVSTSPTSADLHLASGSSGVDQGDANAPASDLDGQARPRGAAPDIGADER